MRGLVCLGIPQPISFFSVNSALVFASLCKYCSFPRCRWVKLPCEINLTRHQIFIQRCRRNQLSRELAGTFCFVKSLVIVMGFASFEFLLFRPSKILDHTIPIVSIHRVRFGMTILKLKLN